MSAATIALAGAVPGMAFTQAPAAPPATVHGHVNNAAGMAIKAGDVKLTSDKTSAPKDRTYKYDFPIDANGDLQGCRAILQETTWLVVFVDGKSIDFQPCDRQGRG